LLPNLLLQFVELRKRARARTGYSQGQTNTSRHASHDR
jgi:hypothetical protein